jgi:hypothetical protein
MRQKSKNPIPRVMSRAAYARYRGCDVREVRRALKSGLIHIERDGSIDPVRADREWAAGTNPASAKRPGMKPSESTLSHAARSTFADARARTEGVKAELSELRLRERQGQLVDRPKAVEAIFDLARVEREAWQSWPARVAALIASEVSADPHLMETALDRHVREHLQQLADIDPDAVLARLAERKARGAS